MKINVLDKGYVSLANVYGNELDIVNAARVSFAKESKRFAEEDARLINYLLKHGHYSPFRHVFMQLEFYAPLMVARQLWKHVVGISSLEAGSNWNESSRRYITEQEEFYMPKEWRLAAKDKKQGSAGAADAKMQKVMQQRLEALLQTAEYMYQEALYYGIAPEQARLFLPAYGMYVRWRWTASVDAILHVLQLRQKADAQWETRQYADAIAKMLKRHFPHTYNAIIGI